MREVEQRARWGAIPRALVAGALLATLLAVTALVVAAADPEPASVAKGGRLYDTWWKEAGVSAPTGDQALWALQTTNKNTGTTTWRCKECHGWDYKGKDGAYGSGSHKTGFVGVSDAASAKTKEELVAILKGSTNPDHNFSTVLNDASIENLADFLKGGLIDVKQYVDYSTKKPIGANADHGKQLYNGTCAACHGANGTQINFGSAESPEYVGTVAASNPQEFLHKVRSGQPGTFMPAAITSGWSMQDVVDVLAYSQSLAEVQAPAAPAAEADNASVAEGGRLYDTWWKEAGSPAPAGDQSLWALQTTNKNTGTTTWRCKECHGWDYEGKDGAYGSGSHKTGFVGVAGAAGAMSKDELTAILKGSSNPDHNFSTVLNDASIGNLADFLKGGLIDVRKYVDYSTKKPIGADSSRGQQLYTGSCAACHGANGKQINFGSADAPEYVGTVATSNPQEFLHKVRSGQPGTSMPAAITSGWSMQDVVDVLSYSQRLGEVQPDPWEAEFQAVHGRAPNDQDRLDRAWSLEFAATSGRNPTDEDWVAHWFETHK